MDIKMTNAKLYQAYISLGRQPIEIIPSIGSRHKMFPDCSYVIDMDPL